MLLTFFTILIVCIRTLLLMTLTNPMILSRLLTFIAINQIDVRGDVKIQQSKPSSFENSVFRFWHRHVAAALVDLILCDPATFNKR